MASLKVTAFYAFYVVSTTWLIIEFLLILWAFHTCVQRTVIVSVSHWLLQMPLSQLHALLSYLFIYLFLTHWVQLVLPKCARVWGHPPEHGPPTSAHNPKKSDSPHSWPWKLSAIKIPHLGKGFHEPSPYLCQGFIYFGLMQLTPAAMSFRVQRTALPGTPPHLLALTFSPCPLPWWSLDLGQGDGWYRCSVHGWALTVITFS